MTLPEFKAWLEGFMQNKEAPTAEEWSVIESKLKRVRADTPIGTRFRYGSPFWGQWCSPMSPSRSGQCTASEGHG